jgi:GNAT superfamily N-acetyltransferase
VINRSYVSAQSELFAPTSPRASAESIAHVIAEGELVVAEREGEVVGAVLARDLDDRAAFFGLLSVHPETTSTGVARDLLDALEADAKGRGLDAMELDLLVPETPTPHQSKLRAWYERRDTSACTNGPSPTWSPRPSPRCVSRPTSSATRRGSGAPCRDEGGVV